MASDSPPSAKTWPPVWYWSWLAGSRGGPLGRNHVLSDRSGWVTDPVRFTRDGKPPNDRQETEAEAAGVSEGRKANYRGATPEVAMTMRGVGTGLVVFGLLLATVGDNLEAGFMIGLMGWLMRGYRRWADRR